MSDAMQDRITTYWSTHASAYDASQTERLERPGAREVWARVWSAALPAEPAHVLDLGTGSGNVAHLVAQLGHRVTGVDLAEGMLAEARRKGKAGASAPLFLAADAVNPRFAAGSLDALTARYVLWTLRDPSVALRNWLALLRPGGVLVVVDSLWFPGGLRTTHDPARATDRDREFRAAYNDDALRRLPLAEASDIRRAADLLKASGFTGAEIAELPEVMDLDHRYGVAPGHCVQMQYRITARRPWTS